MGILKSSNQNNQILYFYSQFSDPMELEDDHIAYYPSPTYRPSTNVRARLDYKSPQLTKRFEIQRMLAVIEFMSLICNQQSPKRTFW